MTARGRFWQELGIAALMFAGAYLTGSAFAAFFLYLSGILWVWIAVTNARTFHLLRRAEARGKAAENV
jgi:hypothetical protein